MTKLKIDRDLLMRFERGLDPRNPEDNEVPTKVLGYGEMSTVFTITGEGQGDLAYKRMPIFEDMEEAEKYRAVYNEYNDLLNKIGITVPPFDSVVIENDDGQIVMFGVQKILDPASIAHKIIHSITDDEIMLLVRLILREIKKTFDFNKKNKKLNIVLDAQISNWAVKGFDPKRPKITEKTEFFFIDTTTPLFRKDGVEQLDPELILRAAPSFLLWIVRLLFVEDVISRYYDFHLSTIDLVANFYKEQRSDLIPALIDLANDFFETEAKDLKIEPITMKKVNSYYREDVLIWRLWLFFRKVDRFIRTKITRKGYPFILPGKIKRY
ncbi:MAG: hypothetical protein JW984_12710 [Deltaproteobacteria bacterium]|uniref:Uncharacterized protein n=1 Tax=Candidatus Zymogenus saltonus TaxID=2844893 RepID=A0A9D8KH43_9DELT|nr:hypothetical protein [Candidatus Zymogenus saltonus]